jgi:hypothetical protein
MKTAPADLLDLRLVPAVVAQGQLTGKDEEIRAIVADYS